MSLAPAVGFIPQLNELDDFVWATLKGWGALPARRLLHRGSLNLLSPDTDPDMAADETAERLQREEEEQKLIKFADDQAEQDYPYLFSLVVVRLWSILEAAVDQTLLGALAKPAELPDSSAVEQLEGPLIAFADSDDDTRAELLLDLLRRDVKGASAGVTRHENLLHALGLGGPVTEPMRRILLELAEIRHCVVHRNGRADAKLIGFCPWLQLQVGDAVPADARRFWFHRTAVYWYLTEIGRRWAVWKGEENYETLTRHMAEVVEAEMADEWKKLQEEYRLKKRVE